MKRLLLVPVFGLAVSALAVPAHAQLGGLLDGDRLNYSAEARQPYYEARRIAYDNRYREGLQEGEKDGRRQDQYEFATRATGATAIRATTGASAIANAIA